MRQRHHNQHLLPVVTVPPPVRLPARLQVCGAQVRQLQYELVAEDVGALEEEERAAWDQSLFMDDVYCLPALAPLLDALLRRDQPLRSLTIRARCQLLPEAFAGCGDRLSGLTALRLSSMPAFDNTLAWRALQAQVPHACISIPA